jgi:hypothetical protein
MEVVVKAVGVTDDIADTVRKACRATYRSELTRLARGNSPQRKLCDKKYAAHVLCLAASVAGRSHALAAGNNQSKMPRSATTPAG